MSDRVDQFCEKSEGSSQRAGRPGSTFKANVQKLPEEGEQALQKYLNETRSRIAQRRKTSSKCVPA